MDLGPTWLRQELPHPLAHAWNLSLTGRTLDGMAAAGAVEVALRFVSALQLASVLAAGGKPPAMLRDGGFKRPTLGSWRQLVRTLKPLVKRPVVPFIAQWPDDATGARLDELLRLRNDLAHDQMSPTAREALDQRIAELAAAILESLAPLRRTMLFRVVDQRQMGQRPIGQRSSGQRSSGPHIEGRLQVLRGAAPHPTPQPAAWLGEVETDRLYFAAEGGKDALPVEPFVARACLQGARVENTCLWKAVGERGDVLLSDDANDTTEWRRVPERLDAVPFQRQRRATSPTDATRHEGPTLEPPTVTGRPAARPRAWRPWVVAGLTLAAGATAWLALYDPAPGPRPDAPTPNGPTPNGAAPTLDDSTTRPEAAAALPPPADAACRLPELAARWDVSTRVLAAKPGSEAGLGVVGFYEVAFRDGDGCVLLADMTRTGWLERGERKTFKQRQSAVRFRPDQSGATVYARPTLSPLVGEPSPERVLEMALRVTRQGRWLVGVWRHEGEAGELSGYCGALAGVRRGDVASGEGPPLVFSDCVADCYHCEDPRDEATAACLTGCARRLAD